MLVMNAVDHEFVPQSVQTKDFKIGCFFAKHSGVQRGNTGLLGVGIVCPNNVYMWTVVVVS